MQKPSSNRGDIVSGVVLAGLGLFIILEARRWDYLGTEGPGPGFFPLWYGIVMVALALLLIATSVRRSAASQPRKPVDWREVGRAFTGWAALAAAIALLKVLGFLISFALLAAFVARIIYRQRIATALAVAVGLALAFYLLFPFALNVSLPVGVLGI